MLPHTLKELGAYSAPHGGTLCFQFVVRRLLACSIAGLVVFTLLLRIVYIRRETKAVAWTPWPSQKLPPLYERYHKDEHQLPQHLWNSPAPYATEPKYFWVSGHSRGVGWGNVLQEIILNAHLAYKAKRAFVFYNYTWNDDGSDYSNYNGKPIPSRIPLSALIRGPIAGGTFPPGDPSPLAISEEYWHATCEHRKRIILRGEVHGNLSSWYTSAIVDGWVQKLDSIEEPCVEAGSDGGALFDWMTFGDKDSMHALWPDISRSPILTHFFWSPLVERAFDTNRAAISPSAASAPALSSLPLTTTSAQRYTEIPGLLVLHIRRGDYEAHCTHLAKWSSTFLAFNALPPLPDRFAPPAGGGWGENTAGNYAVYRGRCFPSVAQIVRRVREVVRADSDVAGRGVESVYVMTNGEASWVVELKEALARTGRFKSVASSRDVVLDGEQKYVAQAVDMLVGQRAQVFIGNGWSSLTGNIVLMRLANGFRGESTRFW
ncbi:hypothetical protein C8Q78DRAFT_1098866 [Trametes maxima]|nr:hypothetical protein C8Q78DRAFT_1098866 [Trametes maxima]